MNFKKTIFNLIILSTIYNSEAFTYKDSKKFITAAAGTAMTLSLYKYYDEIKFLGCHERAKAFIKTGLITSSVGFVCSKMCYWLWHPKSYFTSAKSKIDKNKKLIDFFVSNEFIDQQRMDDLKQDYDQCIFPLPAFYDDILDLIKDSNSIVKWLNLVINQESLKQEMRDQAKIMLKPFDSFYFSKLDKALLMIKEDPCYAKQKSDREFDRMLTDLIIMNNNMAYMNCIR